MLDLPKLELVTAVLTGAAALTLMAHHRSRLGSIVEFAVWGGFVAASGLCFVNLGDPKLQEATVSTAWGMAEIARIQASFVMDIVRGWMVAQRFAIANWIVIAAGVDILMLAFIGSMRSARLSQSRIHLGEWFELPRLVPSPVAVPVADPLAAIDQRLAAAARTELQTIKRGFQTSPTLARAAVGAAHLLGPGHLRLRMVKLAIKIRSRRGVLAAAATSTAAAAGASMAMAPSLTTAKRRTPHRHRRHGARSGRPATAGSVTPLRTAPRRQSGAAGRMNKVEGNGSAPAFRDRLAS